MATRLYKFEAEERYMELLDDCYPEVHVGESVFAPSVVLKECDPVAFDISLHDYIVRMVEEGEWVVDGYEEYEPEEVCDEHGVVC